LLITVHFIIEHTSVASIARSGYLKKIRIKEQSVPTYFKNVKEPSNFCEFRAGGRSFKFLPLPVILYIYIPGLTSGEGLGPKSKNCPTTWRIIARFLLFSKGSHHYKGKKREFF
jgi:hypothetical protein